MHRCFIDPAQWQVGQIHLSRAEERHMLDVLRLSAGDEVEVFDGQGRSGVARLVSCESGSGRVALELLREREAANTACEVILVVALPKGKRMELVVEKATELGVSEIRPVISERVIARPEGERGVERAERWRRIARSAAKQCGREQIPRIAEIAPLSVALGEAGKCDLFLVGSLEPDAAPLRDVVAENRGGKPGRVAMLIGPEGDLSPDELHAAKNAGAIPVSFGATTLRVETAAIFAACIMIYEFCG